MIWHARTQQMTSVTKESGFRHCKRKAGKMNGHRQTSARGFSLIEGLVVCSTRVRIEDVPDDGARALSIDLDNLDAPHGAEYLRLLNVAGPETELTVHGNVRRQRRNQGADRVQVL